MAATKGKLTKPQQENIRERIKTSQLINRLQGFALGENENNPNKEGETKPIEIDGTRLKAIEILLRKSLPDLSQVQMEVDGGLTIKAYAGVKKGKNAAG